MGFEVRKIFFRFIGRRWFPISLHLFMDRRFPWKVIGDDDEMLGMRCFLLHQLILYFLRKISLSAFFSIISNGFLL